MNEPRPRRSGCASSSPSTRPDGEFPAGWNGAARPGRLRRPALACALGSRRRSRVEQLAIDEVMRELHVPRPLNPIGIGWAGPTLLVAGTEAQQQRVAARASSTAPRSGASCSASRARAATSRRCTTRADARRRGVRRERAEGLDDARARRALRHPARAHRPRRDGAGRHHLLRRRHAHAGDRGAPARADDRHARVQRGVLHRRARARPPTSSAPSTTGGGSPRSRSATSACRSRARARCGAAARPRTT